MTDMFFGSREGRVKDPYGNVWTIATLKKEVAPEEMQRRGAGLLTLHSVLAPLLRLDSRRQLIRIAGR